MCWCVCKYLLSSVTLFLFPLSLSTPIPLFQSLSLAERKELLEAWVEQKEHCPTIMAQVSWSPDQHHQGHHLHHLPHLHLPPHQVSGCSFRDALELTRHAESLGVAAIGNIIHHRHYHDYHHHQRCSAKSFPSATLCWGAC